MGILDAPADTFFVAAMMALFARRMSFYVVAASLLLLTREMYCLFAFGVFVATAMNRFDWRDVAVYWKRVALSAVPGIVMLSWTAYLAIHFHMSPIKARTNNPNMSSWPFKMAVKYIKTFYNTANLFEFRMALISTFTLILVLVLLVRGFRRLPLAIVCTLPYVLITTALGAAMWESHGSHMRVATAWVLIGVFMLPFDKSLLLRFMLVLQGIVGVSVHTDLRLLHPALHSSNLLHEEAGFYQPNPAGSPDNELLNDVRSSVEWVDAADVVRPQYHGVWDRVHREIKPITVAITNRTDVAWQPGFGRHPLWLGYILYDGSGQKQLATHSIMLNKAIGPGETKEVTAYLELRRPGKNYVVEFSVWQDGVGWFVRTDPSFGTRYQFRVE
jgi:hypothetical protein